MKEFGIFALTALAAILNATADLSVKTGSQPPPAQLAEPVAALLSSAPVQLADGDKRVLSIWFRRELPLKSKPASPSGALESIAETTLVAAVAVDGPGLKDYKDNDIPQGVYTARFAMQPQDGDHLGTAEFNTFLVLIAPDADKAVDTFKKFTPMVKASGKLTSSGHPLIVSLRPASSAEAKTPALTEPASAHKAIQLKITGKTADGQSAEIPFELVYAGHGHIQ